MPKKTFQKEIIRPGVYKLPNGRKVDVTSDRIKHWADQHKKMISAGLWVPSPYHHDESAVPVRDKGSFSDRDASKNGGFWSKLWVDDSGTLVGEIEAATEEDAKSIGTKVKGVSLLAQPNWQEGDVEWKDAITHIALTNKPVAKGTAEFVALSLDSFAEDLPRPEGDTEAPRTTATLETCLEILASLGMPLPSDTTPDNLVERICVAGPGLVAHKQKQEGEDLTEQPAGSRVQAPSPIAMSSELEFAIDLLNQAGATDDQGNAWTVDAVKASVEKTKQPVAALSAEDQAAVNWVKSEAKKNYAKRIEACVHNGQISPKIAKEHGIPMLDSLQVAFSAEGERIPGEIDRLLAAWESIPAGSMLTGTSPTGYAQQSKVSVTRNSQGFSIDLSGPKVAIEDFPDDDHGMNEPMDESDVDDIVSKQLAMSGM